MLQIHIERSAEPCHVHADTTRLAQVFSNLLNNAAKYSPPGGLITVRTQREGQQVTVDDNRDAAQTLAMVLELQGHAVQVAFSGREALHLAPEFRPRIVLLDIGMPDLDGYQTARHLRQQPWASGTQLIALTGWGQEQDRRQALAAGFDHHAVKPIDPLALIALITEILQR